LQAREKRVDDAMAQLFEVLQFAPQRDRIDADSGEHQHYLPP
jgi:hypothetical protein